MLGNRRLVLDQTCEVFPFLKPWTDETFYEFSLANLIAGSIYVVGRQQLMDNIVRIRDLCNQTEYCMIFNNSAEGSWTLESQLKQLKIDDLVKQKRLLVISGASMSSDLPCLVHEYFLSKILDFDQTFESQQRTPEIFDKKHKPYKFLFLNGRARPHRKYLYEKFKRNGLLEQSLYTMLEAKPSPTRYFEFKENDINILATPTPLKRLPDYYEVPSYRNPVFGPLVEDRSFIKMEMFRNEWGEIYLYHRPYVDTYFSLVTETVCAESKISFRTEKIAKPLAMGHPFIVAANEGFYRDLRNLGFKTFDSLIDEKFDLIEHVQSRMDRLIQVIDDLCKQDLPNFLDACRDICKYNQQHLKALADKTNQEFPNKFFQMIKSHG